MIKALAAIGTVIYRRSAAITDWFIPDSLRTDAATLGRARIFVFSHLFGSYHYGGVSSPFLPWLLNALLLLFFYLGDRPRLRYLVLALFALNVLGFYLAYAVNHSFPEHVPIAAMSGLGLTSV